jgi:hypothetical protein
VDEALVGLAGIVFGALLGGTGRYWLLRRDAWSRARTSGLLLLADVRALRAAEPTDRIVSQTELGVTSWASQREVLAGFRRGNFPNGYRSPEWLELASHFARLDQLRDGWQPADGEKWRRAQAELEAAEHLLGRFENDPPVFGYVIKAIFRR